MSLVEWLSFRKHELMDLCVPILMIPAVPVKLEIQMQKERTSRLSLKYHEAGAYPAPNHHDTSVLVRLENQM